MFTTNEALITKNIIPQWMAEQLYAGCPVIGEEDGLKIIKTLNGIVYVRDTSNNNALAHGETVMYE